MSRLLSAALAAVLLGGCATTASSGAPSRAASPSTPYPSTYAPIAAAPVLISGATVLIGDGQRLDGADVLLRDGRVAAVGRHIEVPAQPAVLFDDLADRVGGGRRVSCGGRRS